MGQREPGMGDQNGCPSQASFVQWQQGQLPPEQVQDLIQHLETCAVCLETLEVLVAADPVSRHLRQGPPPVSAEEQAALAGLVPRLRRLAAPPEPGAPTSQGRPAGARFDFLDQPQTADEIGRLGRYRIQRLLGQGGMGLVFQAEDLPLRRPVALKVMRPEAEDKPGAGERFLREARTAAAVRHEHVVTIYHVGAIHDVPFLVMELLQGQSLETRCKDGPPLSLSEVVRIGREVAEGLAAAHEQGLTHRDIKPDNIWLEAPRDKVKLLDFGLARAAAGETQLTQHGLIVGTPAYMAPEQACGQAVDARADLFSLGCVLYRLTAGRLPFPGETPLAVLHALANDIPPPLHLLDPKVPESFSRLVAALLARRPEARPASARAVVAALAAVEREGRAPNPSRPWCALLMLLAGLLLTLALVAGAGTVLRLETEQGELVIQTSDPQVSVLFEQGKVRLHDRQSGKKYCLTVGPQKKPSGAYEFEVTDEDAGLTFSTSRLTLKRGEPVLVQVSFRLKPASPSPSVPVPADALQRQDIPADLLARAGGGDPTRAPPELVAVLGGPRHFPIAGVHQHYLCTQFSPDGKLLATCANKTALVYEVATGQVLWRLTHDQMCGWLDFRPDSKALAVSWKEGIDLWDLSTGKPVCRLTGHAHLDRGLSFTPDGRFLITTDSDGKARLWEVASLTLPSPPAAGGEGRMRGKVVRTFAPPPGHRFAQAPQIHPEGRLVALHASGPEPVVCVLDLSTGEQTAEVPGAGAVPGAPGLTYQTTVRFTPDGRLLAAVGKDRATHLWEVASWKETGVLVGGASILTFSRDGSTLFKGHVWNGARVSVVLADLKAPPRKSTLTLPIAGDLSWSDLSPDGRTVAVRTHLSNGVRLFDAATGQERFPLAGHRSLVSTVSVSPDGAWVLSTGHDHRVLLWDLRAGRVIRELAFVPPAYQVVSSGAFSPDGKQVAAMVQETSSPSWIRVWEAATGKEVVTLRGQGHAWQPSEFAFHPKGGALITSDKNQLKRWSLRDGSSTTWEEGPDKPIDTVAFHPDGRRVATGDRGGGVCLWDAATYQRLRQFRCEGAVLRVRFSPDGATLAATTATPEGALYLWDLQTGAKTRRVGPIGHGLGLAWRPDSQALATAANDGTLCLWPRDPEKEPRTIRLPGGLRRHLAFTPEGRHLLTANADGSIFVLRLAAAP